MIVYAIVDIGNVYDAVDYIFLAAASPDCGKDFPGGR
jgi:hypothetical protein